MAPDAAPTRGGMTSLYANLLTSSAEATPGTISSAPVTYKQPAETAPPEQDEAAKKQQALAASLRFQPTKRPQIQAQKAKAKAIAAKFSQPPTATADPSVTTNTTTPTAEKADAPTLPQPSIPKTTLADWTADDDINDYYGGEKRQRGGRKKRKKNREARDIPQDWDDIYDPSRPNNYEEYKHSDEKIREMRDWKDRLYAHRMKRRETTSDYDSEEDDRRPLNNQFAPPSMSFAPPKTFDEPRDDVPPPPPVEIPDDATGEDAYARRMRLSQQQQSSEPPPPPPSATAPPPAPPPGQISRAPVRYNLPAPPPEIPSSEGELEEALVSETSTPTAEMAGSEDAPKSKRPGQAGFAERLLSKYGWTKGTGLGASGTGIINPLYAKVDKRKMKSDAEGGGFATPAGHGKILGGHKDKKGQAEEEGKFGKMSEVIVLKGMLRGLDLDQELSGGDGGGGIMQEIGEECADKYGTVERVYIHRTDEQDAEENDGGPLVFVKFTSQLSALRAVNALEGRIFGGNEIRAKFWDREKFDDGVYV